MNKFEKLMCLIIGGIFAWYVLYQIPKANKERALAAAATTRLEAQSAAKKTEPVKKVETTKAAPTAQEESPALPIVPEKRVVLENDAVKLELSSWGAGVRQVVLKKYARDPGPMDEKNPSVVLDFSDAPLGALSGVEGLASNASYEIASQTSNEVVFVHEKLVRKVTLAEDYRILYDETFTTPTLGPTSISLGLMTMGGSKNDLLSVDSYTLDSAKGKAAAQHHAEGDSPLKNYLVGGISGGCSGSKSAEGFAPVAHVTVEDAQKYVAIKNRFFVSALAPSETGLMGFEADIARDIKSSTYRPASVTVRARFAPAAATRREVFFVGPKKQALLWDLGMKDVMEFGMWRWVCYPLVSILNFFYRFIPNYGIAIILLTILVRLVFWPLTRKSTEGMKKMQELQPLMKELQAKYKGNPQRLQQETMALYREKKVNPMSSCLPMLIQIPIFIALFNVLRAAVELRYAPFLWIGDLSEPEHLFASWFPFGGLNILPLLMAGTMALQSALTPSAGDRQQQKMMIVFMPLMMLFMFYNFPSALSLYWTLSQVMSIIQMWMIRRGMRAKTEVLTPEVIDPPETRQMRRHG